MFMLNLLNIIKKEWFLVGMLGAIVVAILAPALGQNQGALHLETVTHIGIAIIFFLHGIGLSPEKIRSGLSNWRLHLAIQITTFGVYPLIWVISHQGFYALFPTSLAIGFCYLLVLPSTISSSVAMTAIGKGNVPGAIFNASLSSVLGVILTPLLMGLLTTQSHISGAQELSNTITTVAQTLLLPMLIGQLCRPFLAAPLQRYRAITGKIDKWVIILIVLNAFSNSVADHIWQEFSLSSLISSILICCVILIIICTLLQHASRWLKFNHEDEVATVFCGTKKTLAAGIPMAQVIFGGSPDLGMILLPIMLYHPIQLFYCAFLANRYAAQAPDTPLESNTTP